MPKALTRSGDLFSRDWAMCQLPERSLRFLASRSRCGGPKKRESKKSCWRKPQNHSRRRSATGRIRGGDHDGGGLCHCLLLDCFVFLQRDRKRIAFNRSSALAAECETSHARRVAVESLAQASRTPIGNGSARYQRGGHLRSDLAYQSAGSLEPLYRL